MYCVFCGAELPDFACFCKRCGKPIDRKDDQSSTDPASSMATKAAKLDGLSLPPEPIQTGAQDGHRDGILESKVQAIILEAQISAFEKSYSEMSDEALLHLTENLATISEPALSGLKSELRKRSLAGAGDDEKRIGLVQMIEPIPNGPNHPLGKSSAATSGKTGSSWGGRFLVFIVWGAIGLAFVLVVFGRGLDAETAYKFSYHTTQMFLNLTLFGWLVTGVIAGRWLTIKRTMIIATVMYISAIGWIAIKLFS